MGRNLQILSISRDLPSSTPFLEENKNQSPLIIFLNETPSIQNKQYYINSNQRLKKIEILKIVR